MASNSGDSSLEANSLFNVNGLVALVTGGGSGELSSFCVAQNNF
jgi:hypothetical protein